MYDIAIIGLGPAGASFARLVDSQRYRVVALDRKDAQRPGGFRKPCGGLLSPKAQRALAKFNLSIPGHIVASPQIFYVKTIDMDHHLQRNYQRFYLNINRHRFDLWLMSLIPNTVTVYDRSSVTQIDDTGGVYTITFFRGKKKKPCAPATSSTQAARYRLFQENFWIRTWLHTVYQYRNGRCTIHNRHFSRACSTAKTATATRGRCLKTDILSSAAHMTSKPPKTRFMPRNKSSKR
jgi:choline dehydrogenase-like flavoprotein